VQRNNLNNPSLREAAYKSAFTLSVVKVQTLFKMLLNAVR